MPKLGFKDQNTVDRKRSRLILKSNAFVRVSFFLWLNFGSFNNLENTLHNYNFGHKAESKARTRQASEIGQKVRRCHPFSSLVPRTKRGLKYVRKGFREDHNMIEGLSTRSNSKTN